MSTTPGRRAAQAAAVAFGLLTLGAGLATVPLDRLAHQPDPHGPLSWLFVLLLLTPGVMIGTLLAARRPRNPIGWMLLAFYLLAQNPKGDYAIIDYRLHHGYLPLGSVAVIVLASWPVWLVLIAVLLWVFPDGRLPQGRWRRVAVVLVPAGALLAVAATAGGAAAVAGHTVRVDASGNLVSNAAGAAGLAQGAVALGVLASLLVWLAVQVPRYRRSAGERRQQFKWLYTGATIFVVSVISAVQVSGGSSGLDKAVNNAIAPAGFAVLPVCVGVAVLRYRLYDIDRIISRVISYAIITAVLAGVFAGLVLLATVVLPFKTPGGGRGRHAGRRGAIQPAAQAGPAGRGPPVQPGALQRRGDRGRVHRAAAPDRRPGHGTRRSGRRGPWSIPARPRLGVAPRNPAADPGAARPAAT